MKKEIALNLPRLIENDVVTMEVKDASFDFPICISDQTEKFGQHDLRHIWMDRRAIYGQRKRVKGLNKSLADCFWAICKAENVDLDLENQQRYLIARLCPYMRSNASKKIFNDASVTFSSKVMAALAYNTEQLLAGSCAEKFTPVEFWENTRNILGPTDWPASNKCYSDFEKELLEEPCHLLITDVAKANEVALERLANLNRRFGRHAGYPEEKTALGMLAYESRVAVHDCYGSLDCIASAFQQIGI